MAVLYALAAFVALSSNPRTPLASSFAKFAILAAAFFMTVFDAHTTRSLVILFHATYACVPFALVGLSLRLPDDVAFVARHPRSLLVLDALALVLAAVVVARDLMGLSVVGYQSACTLLFGGAMIFFVVVLGVWRYLSAPPGRGVRRSRSSSRRPRRPTLSSAAGSSSRCSARAAPVRHSSRSPRWRSPPSERASYSSATTCWAVGHSSPVCSRVRSPGRSRACSPSASGRRSLQSDRGADFGGALVAAGAGALVSAPLVLTVSRRAPSSAGSSPPAAQYKPTIEQLSEELTEITDPRGVGVAVERTVRRWLAVRARGVPSRDGTLAGIRERVRG